MHEAESHYDNSDHYEDLILFARALLNCVMWNPKSDNFIRSVRSIYKYINDDTYDIHDVESSSSQFSHDVIRFEL